MEGSRKEQERGADLVQGFEALSVLGVRVLKNAVSSTQRTLCDVERWKNRMDVIGWGRVYTSQRITLLAVRCMMKASDALKMAGGYIVQVHAVIREPIICNTQTRRITPHYDCMYDFMYDFVSKSVDLTAHEALSGVFGSISLAAWIFLLVSTTIPTIQCARHRILH